MFSRTTMVAMAMLTVSSSLAAQSTAVKPAQPNFSGTWVMDASKSVADGEIPLPMSAVYTISQHGDSLISMNDVNSELGKTSTKMIYGMDGKAWPNTVPTSVGPIDLSTTLSWGGDTLKLFSTASVQGTDVVRADSWSLSADGRVLTMLSNTSVGGQDYAGLTMVMVKQP